MEAGDLTRKIKKEITKKKLLRLPGTSLRHKETRTGEIPKAAAHCDSGLFFFLRSGCYTAKELKRVRGKSILQET